jgi:eukaryotic-like serine/threonine-protein kinase
MNKKVVLGIIGGCALLSLCGCVVSAVFIYPSVKLKLEDAAKVNLNDALNSLTPTPTQAPVNANFLTYSDSQYGFEIQYPKDWEKEEDVSSIAVRFRSPKEGTSDLLQENVNVVTEDLQGQEVSLQEYTNLSIKNIQEYIEDFSVVEQGKMQVAKGDGYYIVYTGTGNGLKLKFRQEWTLEGDSAYVVTYTAQEKDFSKYEKTAKEMMQTFMIQ